MIENSVVKFLLDKENYKNVRDSIDITDFAKEVQPIIRTVDAHFISNDEAPSLTVDDLSNLYFSTNRSKVDFYQGVFDALRSTEASDFSTRSLIDSLRRIRLLREVSIQAYEVSEGRGDYQQVINNLEALKKPEGELVDDELDDFITTDLSTLMDRTRGTPGLRWRLDSLNKRLGSLRKA